MFRIGDQVVYSCHGVCRICDIETRTVDRKNVQYLVLEPLEQNNSKFYVPTHNEAALSKLRPLLTEEALRSLLHSQEIRVDCWIADENQRKQTYRQMISSCDRRALLQMIHTLQKHKSDCMASGRKFHLCDENFLRDAQRVLSAEFSVILNIPQSEVGDYVINEMNCQ